MTTTTRPLRPALRAALVITAFAAAFPCLAHAQAATLRSFSSVDGTAAVSPLAIRADGKLFGTTVSGGAFGYGTIFSVDADGNGFAVLKNFDGSNSGGSCWGGLLLGTDGRLYGVTSDGGPSSRGTIFGMDADGTNFTVLRNFDAAGAEGASSWAGLTQGSDGKLYGATQTSGALGFGTVFSLNPDGSGFTILRHFGNDANGGTVYSAPIFGAGGKLYGTTYRGGAFDAGVIYSMNSDGSGYVVLHSLYGPADGANPQSGVAVTGAGELYGSTTFGGMYDGGVVYKLNSDGTGFTVLRHLRATNPEGRHAFNATPIVAGNRVYASAAFGGNGGSGSVFSMDLDGSALVVELAFDGGANGGNPLAGVRQGPDGRFFGTTRNGGAFGGGTLFRIGTATIASPLITSAATAGGVYGEAFNYSITATNSPTSYGVSGLPAGLSFDPSTGLISGTLPAPGVFTLGLSATNSGGTGTGTLTLTVFDNVAPVITAPETITAEATSPAGAVITFTATATDAINGAIAVSALPASGSTFPLGLSSISLSATDGSGNTATKSILVNVVDTTAPVISSVTPSRTTLWPANHRIVPISLNAVVIESVQLASLAIIDVVSSDPDDGLGDGDTAGDIEITGDLTVNLRAERAGIWAGRTYSITVEARDSSGNKGTKTVAVFVPASQTRK